MDRLKAQFFAGVAALCVSPLVLASEGFTAGEHAMIGDSIQLKFANEKVTPSLKLENGLQLTYGEIMILGDFYGLPGKAIAEGKSPEERQSRFMSAFNQFASHTQSVQETEAIIKVMRKEQEIIQNALNEGKDLNETYKQISDDQNRQYNCITGGGCGDYWWLDKGRYLYLAETDYDHFGYDAVVAYEVGHKAALEQAKLAREQGRPELLEKAYAMNAFASHYLSDRFSSGHMRTPRRELSDHVSPSTVGSLLSHYMHEEESGFGLTVTNHRGDRWVAYGDKRFLEAKSETHRLIVEEAIQKSADEVYEAYQYLRMRNDVGYLIPQPVTVNSQPGRGISPLFYWDGNKQKLMRRKDMKDPYDYHWTSNWWGWSTLAELSRERGLPNHLQAEIVSAGLKNEAIKNGVMIN